MLARDIKSNNLPHIESSFFSPQLYECLSLERMTEGLSRMNWQSFQSRSANQEKAQNSKPLGYTNSHTATQISFTYIHVRICVCTDTFDTTTLWCTAAYLAQIAFPSYTCLSSWFLTNTRTLNPNTHWLHYTVNREDYYSQHSGSFPLAASLLLICGPRGEGWGRRVQQLF